MRTSIVVVAAVVGLAALGCVAERARADVPSSVFYGRPPVDIPPGTLQFHGDSFSVSFGNTGFYYVPLTYSHLYDYGLWHGHNWRYRRLRRHYHQRSPQVVEIPWTDSSTNRVDRDGVAGRLVLPQNGTVRFGLASNYSVYVFFNDSVVRGPRPRTPSSNTTDEAEATAAASTGPRRVEQPRADRTRASTQASTEQTDQPETPKEKRGWSRDEWRENTSRRRVSREFEKELSNNPSNPEKAAETARQRVNPAAARGDSARPPILVPSSGAPISGRQQQAGRTPRSHTTSPPRVTRAKPAPANNPDQSDDKAEEKSEATRPASSWRRQVDEAELEARRQTIRKILEEQKKQRPR